MPTTSNHTFRLFKSLYWAGLLTVIVLTFAEPLFGLFSVWAGEDWTLWLLFLSVTHVVALATVGWLLRREGKRALFVHAGEQVQTAGYLHTLIGFGAALLVFEPGSTARPGDLQLTQVLHPIGSALLTSILGWFFGGEIIGRESDDEIERASRDQLADLLNDLEAFTSEANERHAAYLDTLDAIVDSQETLRTRQQKVLEDATGLGESVNESLSELDDTTRSVHQHLDAISTALDESLASEAFEESLRGIRTEAESLHDALSGVAEHAAAIDSHLSESRSSANRVEESLKAFASEAPEVHERYVNQLDEARSSVAAVADAVTAMLEKAREDAEILKETPELLAPIREVAAGVSQSLNQVKEAVDGVESTTNGVKRSLDAVNKSGADVENALAETASKAQRMTKAVVQARQIIDDMIQERYYEQNDSA